MSQLSIFIDPDDSIRYEIRKNGKYVLSGLHYGLKEVGVLSDDQCYVKYIENERISKKLLRTRIYTIHKSGFEYKYEDTVTCI